MDEKIVALRYLGIFGDIKPSELGYEEDYTYLYPKKVVALRYFGLCGDVKPSELGYKEAYTCPKCKGRGHTGQGWFLNGQNACNLCGGAGYTEQECKPPIVQDGWKTVKGGKEYEPKQYSEYQN